MNHALERDTITTLPALNAVTGTTTSEKIDVKGAKKITLLLTRADHSAGSSAFTVLGSIDDNTYFDLKNLIADAANSNTQTKARVASHTLSANGTALVALDMDHIALSSIQVKVTETTDGTHSAEVLIER